MTFGNSLFTVLFFSISLRHFIIVFRKSYRCKEGSRVSIAVLVDPDCGQSMMTHRLKTKTDSTEDGVVNQIKEVAGRKTSLKQIATTPPNPQNSSKSSNEDDTNIKSTDTDFRINKDAPRLEDKMALLKVCSIFRFEF